MNSTKKQSQMRFYYLLFFLIIAGYRFNLSYTQVIVNEVCPKNLNCLYDFEEDTPDWIELYNQTDSIYDLSNHHLSDKPTNIYKWQFPSNTYINSQSYILIFASGKDTVINDELHCNFKLAQEGEYLSLSNANGQILDSLSYPFVFDNHSYGRKQKDTSSTIWCFFSPPSPEKSNEDSSWFYNNLIIPSPPQLSHPSGFYAQEIITLQLFMNNESTNNYAIYYTLDGSEPDINNNTNTFIYTQALSIKKNTILKAKVYNETGLYSQTICSVYFTEPIFEQYALPVVSLSGNPEDFWSDENGILVKGLYASDTFPFYGANYWKDWEKPVWFSYFDKHGRPVVEQQIDIKIHGGRGSRTRPMKSIRLMAKEKYGKAVFDYTFFKNKEVSRFKHLVLRNASADFNKAHCRDAFVHNTVLDHPGFDIDVLAAQAVLVYINGDFYGLFLFERENRQVLSTIQLLLK